MPELAWPFLIGRTRYEDYRFVVIPEVMTDAPLAVALRSSTSGDPGEAGSALVCEIEAMRQFPVTVVYRVCDAHAEDFGVPGTGTLTDALGRPILLTEGLVLHCSAASVMESGVARAALDRAHDLVVPAFQRFWVQDGEFTRQIAQPFPVPSAQSGPRLRLQLVGAGRPAGVRLAPLWAEGTAVSAEDALVAAGPGIPIRGGRRSPAIVVAGAIILAALVLAGVVLLMMQLSH